MKLIAVALLLFASAASLAAPPAPAPAPVVVSSPQVPIGDPVAAAEIRHLRELIAANDRLYGAQFEAQKAAVAAALAAAQVATNKAEVSAEKRLDSVNEFRGQLKDQAGTFVTRAELWGYFVGGVGVIVGILMFMLRVIGRRDVA